MPDRDAIARGFEFEESVASTLSGKLRPGSGNQWHSRSDVEANGLLVSCKAEAKRTWTKTRNQLKDAIDYSQGTGLIPALALLDDDGEQLVVMRLEDLSAAFAAEITIPKVQSKGERINVPILLRD